ncbi:16S rRNA (uracil(1498)-N(3))-methyltransferase [Bacillus songklensis]|uniref:Ribosomal RNA small subunit methyltransferase E n=1 Tax=Bacillus songklensis TaxID=1069116 RepID=A0ABV8B1C7_9BACI
MQRYFVKNEQLNDNKVTIDSEDARHITRVMRMSEGDKVICCNEKGQSALCEIEDISGDEVNLRVVEWLDEAKELPVAVTIANGLPKGDKLELVIQKGTELGASAFIPFMAARSIVKWDSKKGAKKVERWSKIAKEAAEQAHRTKVPEVLEPASLRELVQKSEAYDYKIVAYEEEAKLGEKSNLASVLSNIKQDQSLLVVIGPEGGLSDNEVQSFKENGFVICGFGPRILRTETAPLYVLAAVSYHTELMR